MTDEQEERIERAVERKIDRIDALWMTPGNEWSEAEYKAKIAAVDAWADGEYAKAHG